MGIMLNLSQQNGTLSIWERYSLLWLDHDKKP